MRTPVALISLSLVLVSNLAFSQIKQNRPNIIYIMADDLGYADLSGYGRKDYQTPNLDKLALQGIKFVNAYAAAPVCTPTRTAFMTGRYPARTPVGLREPLIPTKKDSAVGLSVAYTSVATLLKHNGYETILIGKWHLGFVPAFSPNNNGFDEFYGIHSGAADYISHKGDGRNSDLYENDKPVNAEGYLTDIFAEKAIQFLKRPHTKPFFLELTFNAPHWPWQGPTDKAYPDTMNFRNGGSPEIYAAMMKSLDDAVGKIMQTLDQENLSNQTMVIFTSDNGGERYSDMGGLSKGKLTLWEGGIRVPAFIRWPGTISPNKVTNQVAVTMDWTATIMAAANTNAEIRFPLDGIDLMPVCIGKKKPISRTLFWRVFQRTNQKSIRDGNWKYLQDEKGEYLFNVAADPGEKKDLKDKEKKIFNQLKNKYSQWESLVLEPVPL